MNVIAHTSPMRDQRFSLTFLCEKAADVVDAPCGVHRRQAFKKPVTISFVGNAAIENHNNAVIGL